PPAGFYTQSCRGPVALPVASPARPVVVAGAFPDEDSMESITKNRQTPETVRAMVARAYGPDLVPTGPDVEWLAELGHGWFNVAYRVTLRDGRDVVLKIAPPADVEVMAYERGAMRIELDALAMVRDRTDVPVPVVDHASTDHALVDADWFFMPFVEGDNLGLVRDQLEPARRDDLLEQLGDANRRLNEIRGERFGPLAGPGSSSWRETFVGIVEDVLRDGERRSVDLGHPYDEVRRVLAANAHTLDEVTEPRFVEWDLWDSNVMVADGRIVAIIDHERALYGDPLMEAGFVGTELPDFGDPAPFVRGYGHAPTTDAERIRRRLYCLHLVLVMVIETAYRGFTSDHDAWVRSQLAQTMTLLTP
ncbi:phosphotransferase family protein, partial [Cellulomonas sp. HZM]|uniref:phosphotransferase family protein n=1 Tax=Cellulomonas sp. HZM TaxID=1454010 RepID=UPI001E39ABB7